MERQPIDAGGLLTELLGLAPEERAVRVDALGGAALVLPELIEQARRSVIGDLAAAIESSQVLVELADAGGGAALRARARRARAQALAYANRFEEALADLEQAAFLAAAAGDLVEAARARMAMIHGLARQGRYDDAIRAGEEARRTFLEAGEEALAARADANLGETHRMRSDPATALECFDRARAALASDPVAAAQLASNRAQALLDLNRFSEAQGTFEEALAIFEASGLSRGAAIVEGNLADLMARQGRIEPALFHFEQARRYFERDRAAGDLARLRAEQADAYATAGLLEDAAEAYRAALADLGRHGMVSEAGRAAVGLGRVATRLHRFDEAAEALAGASAAFRALGHETGRGRARLAEGDLALARGERDAAQGLYAEALRALAGRPAEAATARHALADLALSEADLEGAEVLLVDAIVAAERLDLAPLRADLLQTRARLRTAQGRPDDALADLREAVRQVERVRGSLQAERFRAAFLGARTSVFERLVAALLENPTPAHLAEAFGAVEHARSRALLDLVAGAVDFTALAPGGAADPATLALLREAAVLRGELNALYSRVPELDPAEGRGAWFRRWQEQVRTLERKLQQIENRLSATHGAGGIFAPPIDLEDTRALLAPGTALVEYFIAEDELIAFVVTEGGVMVRRALADAETLAEAVERFAFQVERTLSHGEPARADEELALDVREELGRLHDLLVAPLAGALGSVTKLIVVPYGLLHGVPFHALFDGSSYLIERFEVAYSPSASLLRQLYARSGSAPGGPPRRPVVLGVADELAPKIEDEARAVAEALPDAEVLVGAAATSTALAEAAGRAGLIHLACHGRFSQVSPLSSGLRLADRWLTVRELYGMDFGGAVVVLSGCDTGRSQIGGGDELTGLVRGFFAGGASALVLSLWSLDDNSAREVMALTYRLWHNDRAGLGPALRAAQLQVLERQPNAVFWAPFVLVGRI